MEGLHTIGGIQLKDKYSFHVHSHAMYLYILLHLWFFMNYCMYDFTIIFAPVYVLAEYVVCLWFYLWADDNCYFYEIAWPDLGGRGVKTNW